MEMRMNQIMISASEPARPVIQEQGVELDYVLPDYYPDVCKLIKCFVIPTITNESVSDHRLNYELSAEIRILYCSENSHIVQCVTQILHFSRTAELPPGENQIMEIIPVTDYSNCRALSRRRLDVRSAVTIRIRTNTIRRQDAVQDIFCQNMQLKKKQLHYQSQQLQNTAHVILSEELELGSAKPPLLQIIRCDARPVDQNQKFVSGKIMTQGNLQIQILYACEKEGDGSLEPMSFRIPYSQMIDLDGMTEQDHYDVQCSVISCDLKPVTDENGDVRLLRCEAELKLTCTALRMASESLICDAFSTEHPCTAVYQKLITAGTPVPVSEMQSCSTRLNASDGELDCVYDAWCDMKNLTAVMEHSEIILSGMLCCYVLVRESTGMPRLLEKEEPFESRFSVPDASPLDLIQIKAFAEHCSYTLAGASEVSLKTEIRISGSITHCTETEVLSGIEIQEAETLPSEFALKLYFGKAQEEIWSIAKRCHTSVEAIMDENDLTQEQLSENTTLLIPIIS